MGKQEKQRLSGSPSISAKRSNLVDGPCLAAGCLTDNKSEGQKRRGREDDTHAPAERINAVHQLTSVATDAVKR